MQKIPFQVPSSDGVHTLSGVVFLPEGEIRAVFHVVHGMVEYIGRYESFLEAMAKNGYLACGFDNLGHGQTAKQDEYGFIAERDGWRYLLKDVRLFSEAVREKFAPNAPYYLMGHSMGSFIVRCAVLEEVKPEKLVVMGTGGPNPVAGVGLGLAKTIRKMYGSHHLSPLVQSLAIGGFSKSFPDDPSLVNWLSVDQENRRRYLADPLCTFPFTISAFCDLIELNKRANSPAFFRGVSHKMPILLISGADDPVGEKGKGVRAVYDRLLKENKNVHIKLFYGYRHEILNEPCRDEVIDAILSFLAQ